MYPYGSPQCAFDYGHNYIIMTLQNCERLLAHYASLMKQSGLPHQALVNAKQAHADMVVNMARRGVKPQK